MRDVALAKAFETEVGPMRVGGIKTFRQRQDEKRRDFERQMALEEELYAKSQKRLEENIIPSWMNPVTGEKEYLNYEAIRKAYFLLCLDVGEPIGINNRKITPEEKRMGLLEITRLLGVNVNSRTETKRKSVV